MRRRFLCADNLGFKPVSAKFLVVGVEHRNIPADFRKPQPVVFPQHGAEIADDDQLPSLPVFASEGDDGVVPVVRLNPFIPAPVGVVLPQLAVLQIKPVERLHKMLHLLVLLITKQQPVESLLEVPFDELRKFASHEVELLPRVRHLIGIEYTKVVEFIVVIAGHFPNQRTFSVHHLVVAERQDKVLGKRVGHGERERVVVPLAVQWVERHIP